MRSNSPTRQALGLALALLAVACGGGSPTGASPVSPTATCKNVQWTVLAKVPACCDPASPYGPSYAGVVVLAPEHTTLGEAFPFEVPRGQWLGISTVEVSSKLFPTDLADWQRGSYFHLSPVPNTPEHNAQVRENLILSVPTTAPYMRFSPPLTVGSGTVYADFSNGAPWEQWMSATLTGYLSSDPSFSTCNFLASNAPDGS